MRHLLLLLFSVLLTGCMGIPEGVAPIENFEASRYLGKWYEIARLDHSFERGLSNVSAEYSIRKDGGIRVLNQGFSKKDNEWSEAEGKAYFVNDEHQGHLKVSFFGPFYSSYVIFELEKTNYEYAFISGYNNSYLWLLARTPKIDQTIIEHFVSRSRELGFNTDGLIFVNQE